jgi:cell division protein FtsI/penicillin-binding protein 2
VFLGMVLWALSVDGGLPKDAPAGTHRLPPLRGRILDAHGEVLAVSQRVGTVPNGTCPTTVQLRRAYPAGPGLAHVLGHLDGDADMPEVGIEQSLDRALRAPPYSRRNPGPYPDGFNVHLTIDRRLQEIAEEGLGDLCQEHAPRSAMVIMAAPRTGDILAWAYRPPANEPAGDGVNAALNTIFEPVSAIKPLVIAAALDEALVTPETVFDCGNGECQFGGLPLRDAHPYGNLTVAEILQKSSNIGCAKIALTLGNDRLLAALRRFGIGEITGIPLAHESHGILAVPAKWDELLLTRGAIGLGMATTPMQLVRAYCAIANGERLVQLRLVARLDDPETGVSQDIPKASASEAFLRPETSAQLVTMLRRTCEDGGSATGAAIPGIPVAGKTGTSRKMFDGSCSQSKYFSFFIGFAPADNPAIVLLVLADEPQGTHYGGVVAAPAFSRIAQASLAYLGVAPAPPDTAETE